MKPPSVDAAGRVEERGLASSTLLRGGLAALLIKMSSAVVLYAMFLVVARYLGDQEFGRFALGFSLAAAVASIALVGQHTAIVRFWSAARATGRLDHARGFLRRGYAVTLCAGGAAAVGLLIVATTVQSSDGTAGGFLVGAALLVPAVAFAEYQASAMRAEGFVVRALLPRDVLWGLGVMLFVGVATRLGVAAGSSLVLLFAAALLAFLLVPQALAFRRHIRPVLEDVPAAIDQVAWKRATVAFWAVGALGQLKENADVLVLGLFFAPELAGGYFVALKTTALLALANRAVNIVGAPLISRSFHSRDLPGVQRTCSAMVLGATIPALAGFALLALIGTDLLSIFGVDSPGSHLVLMVLAGGVLVNCLFGPTLSVMTMTGHEAHFLRIRAVVDGAAVVMLFIAVPLWGLLGAACVSALSKVGWNWWVRQAAVSEIGVDPSILGVIAGPRRATVPG